MAKQGGLKVTCDVSVFSMFFSKNDFDIPSFGFKDDVDYLWENIELIDAFSVDRTLQSVIPPDVNVYELAVSLLLTAVHNNKLSMQTMSSKISANPRKIFNLESEKETYVEVSNSNKIEANRRFALPDSIKFHSIDKATLVGNIQRVVARGELVYLEGNYIGKASGRNVKTFSSGLRLSAPTGPIAPRSPQVLPFSPRSTSRQRAFSLEDDETLTAAVTSKYLTDLPRSIERTNNSQFYKRNVISVSSFGRKDLHTLFGVAQEMRSLVEKRGQVGLLHGKVMCSVFWEPSTRTSTSFETAMIRLGGGVVSVNQITSSIAKGETIADTGMLN